MQNLALDLSDLDVAAVEPLDSGTDIALESLLGGHAMAESAASCSVCSCCVVCCCCCCG